MYFRFCGRRPSSYICNFCLSLTGKLYIGSENDRDVSSSSSSFVCFLFNVTLRCTYVRRGSACRRFTLCTTNFPQFVKGVKKKFGRIPVCHWNRRNENELRLRPLSSQITAFDDSDRFYSKYSKILRKTPTCSITIIYRSFTSQRLLTKTNETNEWVAYCCAVHTYRRS